MNAVKREPLASRLRPKDLSEVLGQQHLLAEGRVFRGFLDSGKLPNMVFYGPSGVGKTTVATILAQQSGMQMFKLNGTAASTADIKEVIAEVNTLSGYNGILLYLDEIQYLNKKQQQSLLEVIEDGSVTLIASTTENPYFYIYNALLSRCTVFEFKPLQEQDIKTGLSRAVKLLEGEEGVKVKIADEVLSQIALSTGGDYRKALSALELLFYGAKTEKGKKTITAEMAKQVAQRSAMRYDREQDVHYNLLSALQKSIRGSDPDAALHYLARLLEAGDLLSPCRRLMVIACEDIGLAYPQAISITKACIDAAVQVGLPEAQIPLADAAVLLATAPKSNSANKGIQAAMADVKRGKYGDVPDYLKGTGYSGAEKLGHGIGYQFPHDFPNHWLAQQYLPDEIKSAKYYEYGENKQEQAAKAYWDAIKKTGE